MIRFGRIRFLPFWLLFGALWGCGASSPSGSTTPVTLTLEAPSSGQTARQSFAAVPSGIASIRLDVSAADIDTITDAFNVTPGETVTRTLDVPSGPGRIFTVTAYDGPDTTGTARYRGVSAAVNLEPGVPASVPISMLPLVIPATLSSIAVTPINPSIALGLPRQFTATGTFSDTTTQDLTNAVTWTSSNLSVATVGATGLAATLSVGTTTITATDSAGGVSGSATLAVTAAQLVSIAVTPLNPSIAAGLTQQFTATGSYTDSSTQNLTASVAWSSSATGVATIGSAGLAAGLVGGSTTITAASGIISGSTTLAVFPQITRLSLVYGIIGDTLKMTGSGFGSTQGTGTASIGGMNAATILRWSNTEIAAVIPSGVSVSSTGTSNSALVTVGGQPSNLASVTLFDHTHGVGENDSLNLDKFVLDDLTPTSVTVFNLTGTDSGDTSSIVLSSDGNTAAEADDTTYTERVLNFDTTTPAVDFTYVAPTRDVSISRNGTTVLQADGTNTLILFPNNFANASPTDTSITTAPAGVCFYEVALTSDGNTAAAIGQDTAVSPCDGVYNVYRIDNVLGTPTFSTPISTAGAGAVYTDVAISEDGKTVIAGRVVTGASPVAGIHRIRNFTAGPALETGLATLATNIASCPFNTVDVDLSADGMTGIVGIVNT
ncbi:MAG: Ig-like domain-containing protein, partial [Nitrospirae bacterium]|nr:Ig-like domain-containing protein [Nitrospirota bacterium]